MPTGLNQNFGTKTDFRDPVYEPVESKENLIAKKKRECREQGGTWDEQTQTCILVPQEPKTFPKSADTYDITTGEKTTPEIQEENKKLTPQEKAAAEQKGGVIITDRFGNERIQTPEDLRAEQQRAEFNQSLGGGPSAAQGIAAREAQARQIAEGQALAGGVGQFDQLGIEPTGLNWNEGFRVALADAIPSAIKAGGYGALAGGITGAGVGSAITAPAGAVLFASVDFVASMASSIKSNFASQRRDTTTAQQRILDEGKQTMKAWATMAAADPANKAQYLAQYNTVAAQIDQAYRQMKLDTSQDLAKFETALPNLAEFEAFYAAGGERDELAADMRNALITPAPLDYSLLELGYKNGVIK